MRVNIVKRGLRYIAWRLPNVSRNYVARYVPSLNTALQIMPVAPIKRVIDKINLSNSSAAALLMAEITRKRYFVMIPRRVYERY